MDEEGRFILSPSQRASPFPLLPASWCFTLSSLGEGHQVLAIAAFKTLSRSSCPSPRRPCALCTTSTKRCLHFTPLCGFKFKSLLPLLFRECGRPGKPVFFQVRIRFPIPLVAADLAIPRAPRPSVPIFFVYSFVRLDRTLSPVGWSRFRFCCVLAASN